MTQLPEVVEYDEFRILTTMQLADAFGTNAKVIARNFQRNEEHYETGEHYFSLSGDELKKFKALRQNDASLKYVSVLYLWTEKGAWLHAKSLNTKKAWGAYQMLIDSYYKISQQVLNGGGDNMTLTLTDADWEQVQHRLGVLEMRLEEEITLHSGEQLRLRKAVGERVHQLTDDKGARPVLFRTLYSAIREEYGVDSYRDVKQHELGYALKFVEGWGK